MQCTDRRTFYRQTNKNITGIILQTNRKQKYALYRQTETKVCFIQTKVCFITESLLQTNRHFTDKQTFYRQTDILQISRHLTDKQKKISDILHKKIPEITEKQKLTKVCFI